MVLSLEPLSLGFAFEYARAALTTKEWDMTFFRIVLDEHID